ncbi:phosphotransferase-like protein [Caenimonas koreensis]|uniref:Chloramphenicol 3-O phosphotransferase n=1 Tax=Caenimonas koreensis DSM 17982 TaxID=1121255 RepID=A0A844AV40_9BURK|nr:zeta toxin family protein [Caenimonas koreensis]MRD47964.1 hypothetical protein [Caenimonas koreensis DSM 17982]
MNTPPARAAGRIVVLNGASSSGKTSIAKALQASSTAEAFLHISLDAFRAFEPAGYWSPDVRQLHAQRVESLCRAMNAAAAAYVRAGDSVIVDHVLPPEAWAWLATAPQSRFIS